MLSYIFSPSKQVVVLRPFVRRNIFGNRQANRQAKRGYSYGAAINSDTDRLKIYETDCIERLCQCSKYVKSATSETSLNKLKSEVNEVHKHISGPSSKTFFRDFVQLTSSRNVKDSFSISFPNRSTSVELSINVTGKGIKLFEL